MQVCVLQITPKTTRLKLGDTCVSQAPFALLMALYVDAYPWMYGDMRSQ